MFESVVPYTPREESYLCYGLRNLNEHLMGPVLECSNAVAISSVARAALRNLRDICLPNSWFPGLNEITKLEYITNSFFWIIGTNYLHGLIDARYEQNCNVHPEFESLIKNTSEKLVGLKDWLLIYVPARERSQLEKDYEDLFENYPDIIGAFSYYEDKTYEDFSEGQYYIVDELREKHKSFLSQQSNKKEMKLFISPFEALALIKKTALQVLMRYKIEVNELEFDQVKMLAFNKPSELNEFFLKKWIRTPILEKGFLMLQSDAKKKPETFEAYEVKEIQAWIEVLQSIQTHLFEITAPRKV